MYADNAVLKASFSSSDLMIMKATLECMRYTVSQTNSGNKKNGDIHFVVH